MQETRNNCFGFKKGLGTYAYLFYPTKVHTMFYFFQPEAIVVSFSHLMMLFFNVTFNPIFNLNYIKVNIYRISQNYFFMFNKTKIYGSLLNTKTCTWHK